MTIYSRLLLVQNKVTSSNNPGHVSNILLVFFIHDNAHRRIAPIADCAISRTYDVDDVINYTTTLEWASKVTTTRHIGVVFQVTSDWLFMVYFLKPNPF